MKNPLKKITDKHPLLKFLSNKYVIVLVFFIVWMFFLDTYSYLEHRFLDKEIDELQTNKEYYQNEINKDKNSIRTLKNQHQIEKYAREKYYMKKDNEDIYIIEYEGDTLEK
ncbi:septum formation initiator family protein [Flavobacterium sp.]|jgi:cell division protein DivIC|uniref:septum formation initiator family protein n=1 Tax=Flavobacterium sp. TaxID=239 RepID=UPI0037C19B1F